MEILQENFTTLAFMAFLLFCSGFFSGTESALFSLTRRQISRLHQEGRHVERVLNLLSENPTGLLVAILFGNLVVNILFFCMSSVLGVKVSAVYGEWGQASVGLIVLILVILAGEILPKAIGISFPERIVRINSFPLLSCFHALGPIRRLLVRITKRFEPKEDGSRLVGGEELKLLIEATHHDSTFGKQEKAIVEDIINLPEIRVRELMVPRVEQMFRRTDALAQETLAEAAEQDLSLIPVYEGEEDNIVGVVDICDLFVNADPTKRLSDFLYPIHFVPETKSADTMLQEFLAKELRMVCVVNEYGSLAGTIVLEDLLEEVVGEFDVLDIPSVEQLGEATYRLQGSLGIREWRTLFVGLIPQEQMQGLALDTLSGLVVSLLKKMPCVGDVVHMGNIRFTVERVRSNRIESVLLELDSECDGRS